MIIDDDKHDASNKLEVFPGSERTMDNNRCSLKDQILDLLQNDNEIKCAIKTIIQPYETGRAEISEYEKRLRENEKELEEEKSKNRKLLAESEELKKQNKQYVKEKENTDQIIKEQQEQLKGIEDFANLNSQIKFLHSDSREFLVKLGGDIDSIYAYVIMGRSYNTIKQLWDFIKEKAKDDAYDRKQLEILNNLLYMCIKIYNMYHNDEIEYTNVELESEYESDKYIKTSISTYNGRISEILVKGFYNKKLNDHFKPIVKVQ